MPAQARGAGEHLNVSATAVGRLEDLDRDGFDHQGVALGVVPCLSSTSPS